MSENTEIKLIKMTRGEEKADVHPDEVANYAAGGFLPDESTEDERVIHPMKMKKEDLITFLTGKGVVIPEDATTVAKLQALIPAE
jgi:hypothetical protein